MNIIIQGFVQEPWEAVKSSFVSSFLKRREEDVIWRVRWKDRWLYLYLLLAFQSTPQHFMAIRVAVYVGWFYQDLIKEQKLTSADQLPPVLPIVIYNGKYCSRNFLLFSFAPLPLGEGPGGEGKYRRISASVLNTRWHAPTQSQSLIESVRGLEQYRLQIEYLLLDEGKYDNEELSPLQNLNATMTRTLCLPSSEPLRTGG